MCPICWTLAVLVFLGIGSAGLTVWVQANGYLSFALMLLTSISFWLLTYKLLTSKCKKGGIECMCGKPKK
jgi:hypothetical protein